MAVSSTLPQPAASLNAAAMPVTPSALPRSSGRTATALNGVAAVSKYSTVMRCAHSEKPVLMQIPEMDRITSAITGSRPSRLPGAPIPSTPASPSAVKLRRALSWPRSSTAA
ncbi:hypothetical protein PICSAR181_04105 [Mycobacterium avium subsp. paratuberculosis]|nr:hypothetical protein PICSAR181_04105 [Mycobacterium avium subsp. paratuberculosis]